MYVCMCYICIIYVCMYMYMCVYMSIYKVQFEEKKLLIFNNNANHTLIKQIIELPSFPLQLPVMHLPNASCCKAESQSIDDLLDHTQTRINRVSCNFMSSHFLVVSANQMEGK
eukprot:TRINITY_DN2735_c2_g1_i2.p1 TRINITY_DN2735_c2_g1~~TRINITY_DN2735_c2_g1_i2.p1  ORF type:complete len:113 (+),score=1.79 TRINITY_DN2735_c2_g1_i2:38-376(+)